VLRFYLRRVLRIWPLYFLAVFIGFVIFPIAKQLAGMTGSETADPWLFVTFLANYNTIWNGEADSSVLNVLWSVAIEEQFYLFWPLLMLIFKFNRYILLIGCIVTSILVRFLDPVFAGVLTAHTVTNIGSLALGGLLAQLMLQKPMLLSWVKTLPKYTILCVYAIGTSIMVISILLSHNTIVGIFGNLILSSFFGFIILEQELASNSFYKYSKSKFLSDWGKRTYGLYVLHTVGILCSIVIGKVIGNSMPYLKAFFIEPILAFVLSMTFSYFSYRYFELPFLKLKARFSFISKE